MFLIFLNNFVHVFQDFENKCFWLTFLHYWKWCCSAIRDAFIRQIKEGYSLADKQLRYVFTLEWKSVNEIVQSLLLSCGFKQNLSLWMKPSVWMSSHSTCINKNSKLKVRAQDTHEHRVYSYNTTKHPFRKGWRRGVSTHHLQVKGLYNWPNKTGKQHKQFSFS